MSVDEVRSCLYDKFVRLQFSRLFSLRCKHDEKTAFSISTAEHESLFFTQNTRTADIQIYGVACST